MTTVQEMAEFVILWDLVQQVQLTDKTDEIRWRWTADGIYTSMPAGRRSHLSTGGDLQLQIKRPDGASPMHSSRRPKPRKKPSRYRCSLDAQLITETHARGA